MKRGFVLGSGLAVFAATKSGRDLTNPDTVLQMSPLTSSQRGMRFTGRSRSLASIMSWISDGAVSESMLSLMLAGASSLLVSVKPSKVSKPTMERLMA